MEDNTERLRGIFAEILGYDISEIKNDSTVKELQMDSLDVVDIVVQMEREFLIDVPDHRIENLKCFMDYVNLLEELLNDVH